MPFENCVQYIFLIAIFSFSFFYHFNENAREMSTLHSCKTETQPDVYKIHNIIKLSRVLLLLKASVTVSKRSVTAKFLLWGTIIVKGNFLPRASDTVGFGIGSYCY